MKKKNFADLTDKQKEEEIEKLGTVILNVIPEGHPGLALSALCGVIGYYIVHEVKNPHRALGLVVENITKIVNTLYHDDNNDNPTN